jgi:hypothetical protein
MSTYNGKPSLCVRTPTYIKEVSKANFLILTLPRYGVF